MARTTSYCRLCWCITYSLVMQLGAARSADPIARDTTPWSEGSLLVGGGGKLPDAVYQRFAELAGGKAGRLVLVPTATEDDRWLSNEKEMTAYVDDWKREGIPSVSVLHTRDRHEANRPDFVAPLTTATAVWLGGGDQALLEKAYVGTLVEKEIHGVLARGGIVGGSSAGAAIQSRVMIRAGDAAPEMGTGFDLVPDAIVDQHFLRRNRVNRLFEAVRQCPDRVGVGIDEQTAVLIRNGNFEVLGDSYVMLVRMTPGNLLPQVQMLAKGDTFPLREVPPVSK